LEQADFFNVQPRFTDLLETTSDVREVQGFLGPDGNWARNKAPNPVASLTGRRYDEAGLGNGRLYQSTMLKVDGAAGAPTAEMWQSYANRCEVAFDTGAAWSVCQWNPFVNKVKQEQDNYFPHRDANTITELITAPISDGARASARAEAHDFLNPWNTGVYSNYPEPPNELPGPYPELYWGKFLPQLTALKDEYNPCDFFEKPQTIPSSPGACQSR